MTVALAQVRVTAIARISTTVGPDAKSWNQLIRGIMQWRINRIGSGVNPVDLVPISDIVESLQQCAETPNVAGHTYVTGSASPTTVRVFTGQIAIARGAPVADSRAPLAPYQALLRRTTENSPMRRR